MSDPYILHDTPEGGKCDCGLRQCPDCGLHTMPSQADRCIPCGYNLPALARQTPEAARRAYRSLSGKEPH